MQNSPVPNWFFEEVAALYLCFPSGGPMPQSVPAAWWRVLSDYPEWAIRRAFVRAPKEAAQGQYLPSAELVRRHAEVALKIPPTAANYNRPVLPPVSIDEHPVAEDNPLLELGRKWQAESRQLGISPDQTTPKEVGARRMRELTAALEGKFDA